MILWFSDPCAVANVGGKGAALARLAGAGLPVPPGFCVPAPVLARLEDVSVRDAIASAYAMLDAARVAVRSSAIDEDGDAASFAGVHTTHLGVLGVDDVLVALAEVRASATSEGALAYRRRRGLNGPPSIAAVVQVLVHADVAGVMFGRHPVTRQDRVVIEASWGLGEALVSGLVTPDHFEVDRDGRIVTRHVSDKDVAIVLHDRGTREVPVPAERQGRACLSDDDIHTLVALARRIEALDGGPQDIEWAIAGGRLYLLQARPITA